MKTKALVMNVSFFKRVSAFLSFLSFRGRVVRDVRTCGA